MLEQIFQVNMYVRNGVTVLITVNVDIFVWG